MKINKNEIPVIMEVPGSTMRSTSDCGGMTMLYNELAKGTDFTPLLKGLKNDACQCPHWGYIQEGKILLKYEDGKEETSSTGDFFYWPEGHTALVLEDAKYMEFSPTEKFAEVISHVGNKISEMGSE